MSAKTIDPGPAFEAAPYDYAEARALVEALGLAEPVAIALVRRGHRSPAEAHAFLHGEEEHDPFAMEGMASVAERLLEACRAGERITVHGDYDVDGISATAILVSALREAGADCDWLIPDRAEGYGLGPATIGRLRERGTRILLTADCGITAVEEVAAAREAGIRAIVTDHHQPGEALPDCPILHPEVSGYPFAGLCGTGVAFKLAQALAATAGREREPGTDLDLVALATVADLVPLVGENRTLVRRGLTELRRARRPGVRALLATAGVEGERLDEGDIAFRLGPRLNAAGRLYRADAGVELMLTASDARAAEIAAELEAANRERREVEREVTAAAERARRELDGSEDAPALVLAGEGWHPGVVGIAASRLVDRRQRPAILLSLDGEGGARGSGRSVPGFDLLAALRECSEHLERFGGHRAAAGLELRAERIPAFRAAFCAVAARTIPAGGLRAPERIDAVVGTDALDLEVAEQLRSLGPFGQGNPAVRLLVPWASVGDVRAMGQDDRHARFALSNDAAPARAVAFNANGALSRAARAPSDITVALEVNHWNGAVEPRAVLRAQAALPDPPARVCACGPADELWWARFARELERDPAAGPTAPAPAPGGRSRLDHGSRSAVALVSELASSGGRVLVLAADARRRARLAREAASPARFGGEARIVCAGCPERSLDTAVRAGACLVLTDWDSLGAEPASVEGYEHVVVVDPPADRGSLALAAAGAGHLHLALAGAGDLPARCLAALWQPREALAEIYRGLLAAELEGERLAALLAGPAPPLRRAEVAGRCVRVLRELGLAEHEVDAGVHRLRVVSSERTALERSCAWRAYTKRYEDGLRSLQSHRTS